MRQPVVKNVLILGAWLALLTAPLAPRAPGAEEPVTPLAPLSVEAFETSRTVWAPMGDTTAVAAHLHDGANALRMPCAFAEMDSDRASWDVDVALDLESVQGLQFQFLSADIQPVSHFSVYFRSGAGWYSAGFTPAGDGRWENIRIAARDLGMEGRPSGLHAIDRLRLSAWRGTADDTFFLTRDFSLYGEPSPVVIIRADSLGESGEGRTAQTVTVRTADLLERAGLVATVRSDNALTTAALARAQLVLLPHNPQMPAASLQALMAYVCDGGKIMAFYGFPTELAALLGLERGPWRRAERPGQFAAIAFDSDAAPHLPDQMLQNSWNIQTWRPTSDETRPIARWLDAQGEDAGEAALFLSPRGAVMTHVLMGDDAPAKSQALLALAAHLAPPLAARAAEHRLRTMGAIEPFDSWDALRRKVADAEPEPPVAALLEKADRHRSEARARLEEGLPHAAIAAANAAEADLVQAYYRSRRPGPDGEFRAFWRHRAAPLDGMDWDETIALLARNGFNALLPNLLWAGVAFYESDVLPVSDRVARDGDQIAACLEACKRHGVELHVWKVNFNMGSATSEQFVREMTEAGRTQVTLDGEAQNRWLCPTHPDNQDLEIRSMVEVAEKYDVHGVHFDYIRYPGRSNCFCDGCRSRFEGRIGRTVEGWPRAVVSDPALSDQWLAFRRDHISAVVQAVSDRLRETRPKTKISAAVFRNWPTDRDNIGQDWQRWMEEGWLDFVCPMNYERNVTAFENMTRRQQAWSAGRPLYPGIGVSVWDTGYTVPVIEQIAATRRLETGGFVIFEYDATEAQRIVPECGLGITAVEGR